MLEDFPVLIENEKKIFNVGAIIFNWILMKNSIKLWIIWKRNQDESLKNSGSKIILLKKITLESLQIFLIGK